MFMTHRTLGKLQTVKLKAKTMDDLLEQSSFEQNQPLPTYQIVSPTPASRKPKFIQKRCTGFILIKTIRNKHDNIPYEVQSFKKDSPLFTRQMDKKLLKLRRDQEKTNLWRNKEKQRDRIQSHDRESLTTKNPKRLNQLTEQFLVQQPFLLQDPLEYNQVERNWKKLRQNGVYEDEESEVASYTQTKLRGLYEECKNFKKTLQRMRREGHHDIMSRIKVFENIKSCRMQILNATKSKFKRDESLS